MKSHKAHWRMLSVLQPADNAALVGSFIVFERSSYMACQYLSERRPLKRELPIFDFSVTASLSASSPIRRARQYIVELVAVFIIGEGVTGCQPGPHQSAIRLGKTLALDSDHADFARQFFHSVLLPQYLAGVSPRCHIVAAQCPEAAVVRTNRMSTMITRGIYR